MLANLLGPLLIGGPAGIETRRSENPQGLTVDANHDGYLSRFGVVHQRCMTLSPRGLKLTGIDRRDPGGNRRQEGGMEARRGCLLPFAFTFIPMCACRSRRAAAR